MKKLKPIPKFKTEDEESEFWDTHDTTDYIDWSKAEKVVFPNLRPSFRKLEDIDLKHINEIHRELFEVRSEQSKSKNSN